jgi:hypothetical protein
VFSWSLLLGLRFGRVPRSSAPNLRCVLRQTCDAHRAGGAGDDLHRAVDVVGVEVLHLGLGDLADLVPGQLADLDLVRLAGALLDAGGLLDQLGGRRRLGDEGERAVLVDRDLDRDDVAALASVAALYALQNSMMLTPC